MLQLSVYTPHYISGTAVLMHAPYGTVSVRGSFSEAQLSLMEDVAQRTLCTFSVVDLCYSLVLMIISKCSCL